MKSDLAKLLSPLIINIATCITLVWIGFQIEDVEPTLYPEIIATWIFYYGIGELVLLKKGIEPPSTPRINEGKIDFAWGLEHCYWVHWWPRAVLGK